MRAALPLPDTELGPEWTALELCCRGIETEAEREYLEQLLRSPGFDVGELLWQAMRHRLLAILAQCTAEARYVESLGTGVHLALQLAWRGNVVRLREARQRALTVAEALDRAGIRYVFTKGIAIEGPLYNGTGARLLQDVDLMIRPSARDEVAALLQGLGFRHGRYDFATRRIEPLDRATEIEYRLHPDHLPHLLLPTESPVLPVFVVDVANSLTWHDSPWNVPIDQALREVATEEVAGCDGAHVPVLLPLYSFLFLVLHFFREAWFERSIDFQFDVTLDKVGDVVRAWRRWQPGLAELGRAVEELGVAEPVVWVLEHVDRTMGTGMVAEAGLTDRVDEAWLSNGRALSGGDLRWVVPMRARLRSKDRRRHVERVGA